MSDVIDLTRYKNMEELKSYATAQYLALQSAAERMLQMQEKITHLEGLLNSQVNEPGIEKLLKSPELCLVEAQINLLVQRAMHKELTLEETKQLDLYIKNKRLLTGESTTMDGSTKKKTKEISEAQLIQLARIEKK